MSIPRIGTGPAKPYFTYAEVVARNHARLGAMADKRSTDLFAAAAGSEDLTLIGETMPERVERATAQITAEEPEQGQLF